mgnify:CR=1 FL=1
MPRKAFIDPVTNVLKTHGFVLTNEVGDIAINVPDDFALKPREWKWDGVQFVAFTPPPPPDLKADAKVKISAVPAGPVREALDEILKLL